MEIPGYGGSKLKLPSAEWGMNVSVTSKCQQNQKSSRFSVIFLPLCPASPTHKNPQRHKIICGIHPVGHRDRLIDLKMFLKNILLVNSVAVLVAVV